MSGLKEENIDWNQNKFYEYILYEIVWGYSQDIMHWLKPKEL